MALSFFDNSKKIIEFDEFIEILTQTIVFNDEESLLKCAEPLLHFSNNKSFFVNYLNKTISTNKFEIKSNYNEQSFLIYDCESFYVRITYWPMLSVNKAIKEYQNVSFSYDFAHDHNFSLLTAGYKGEGYWTKLWEYDYEKVVGYKGESVEMNFLEETSLHEGKAIYYRPSKDIHLQLPPKQEDSLALNIILKSYKQFDNRQYDFDINKKIIRNILYGTASSKFGILKLASIFGDENSNDLLYMIATKHEIPLVRQEALNSLYKKTNNPKTWEIGLNDKEKSVYNFSKIKLENIIKLDI